MRESGIYRPRRSYNVHVARNYSHLYTTMIYVVTHRDEVRGIQNRLFAVGVLALTKLFRHRVLQDMSKRLTTCDT